LMDASDTRLDDTKSQAFAWHEVTPHVHTTKSIRR
jgi:hypothetical protein